MEREGSGEGLKKVDVPHVRRKKMLNSYQIVKKRKNVLEHICTKLGASGTVQLAGYN
jgi:hypothetical protein